MRSRRGRVPGWFPRCRRQGLSGRHARRRDPPQHSGIAPRAAPGSEEWEQKRMCHVNCTWHPLPPTPTPDAYLSRRPRSPRAPLGPAGCPLCCSPRAQMVKKRPASGSASSASATPAPVGLGANGTPASAPTPASPTRLGSVPLPTDEHLLAPALGPARGGGSASTTPAPRLTLPARDERTIARQGTVVASSGDGPAHGDECFIWSELPMNKQGQSPWVEVGSPPAWRVWDRQQSPCGRSSVRTGHVALALGSRLAARGCEGMTRDRSHRAGSRR